MKTQTIKKLETIIGKIQAVQGEMPGDMQLQEAARLIRQVVKKLEQKK